MHEIAFTIGKLSIHWYGVFVALAFFVAMSTLLVERRRAGITADNVFDLALIAIFGGVFGARLFYVVQFHRQFHSGKGIGQEQAVPQFFRRHARCGQSHAERRFRCDFRNPRHDPHHRKPAPASISIVTWDSFFSVCFFRKEITYFPIRSVSRLTISPGFLV